MIEGSVTTPLKEPKVRFGSAIVMDCKTGEVLFEHNAHMQRPMASTTKIMTALLALENTSLGDVVTVTSAMLAVDEQGSTKLGLKMGDKITVNDLLYGLMLISGNDCAQALAIHTAGSFDNFASMMNERASEIGMTNSHFITPSGLDDVAHFSTAYDMALLAVEAMKNEEFAEVVGTRTKWIYFGNPMEKMGISTHNYLIQGLPYGVKGCDGIKTGYTDVSGYCLVSHVERDGKELVCVTLGMPRYYIYHEELYNYACSLYMGVKAQPVIDLSPSTVYENAYEIPLVGGSKDTVAVTCDYSGDFKVLQSQYDKITYSVETERFVYAPVNYGQVVGYLRYYYLDSVVAEFPITVCENIELTESNWLSAYLKALRYDLENN